ncbi:MAG: hypothetical protein AB1505_16190 [Candidatus Latescibacterota bacterium]
MVKQRRVRTPVLLALALALFLVLPAACTRTPAPEGFAPASPVPLAQFTTHPATDRAPCWSPDGRWLAFSSDRSGDLDIWIVPAEGGPARQVTRTPQVDDYVPRWSPDGTHISFNSGPLLGELRRMPAAGGPSVLLADGRGVDSRWGAAWSPDGRWLAYVAARGVWKIPAAGGTPLPVTTGELAAAGYSEFSGPSWSADGRAIAFGCALGGRAHVWTVPASGGAPSQVTVAPGDGMWMSWSPDGRRLAFAAVVDGDWDIWTVPAAGGLAERLTAGPGVEVQPDWSPDGRRIVYTRRGDIWGIPAAGGSPVCLLDTPEGKSSPRWSPDGSSMVSVNWVVTSDIWIADLGGPPAPP